MGAQPAACTLIIFGRSRTDPAQGFHFVEGLPHAEQADSAAGGIDDALRHTPAELFGDFVAHGFLAFDAVGLFRRAHVEPAVFFPRIGFFQLGDFFRAVADQAVDQCDVRAVVIALDAVGHGDVFGHEDVGFESGGGGVGGEGSGGVSGGWNRQLLQAEVAGHGYAGGQAAGFERSGGIQAFVLDVDVGIFAAGEHGREAFAESHGVSFGQDGIVAPHGRRAGDRGEQRKMCCLIVGRS